MADDGGLARLLRRMDQMPAAVRAAVVPALDKGADELVSTMKSLAPLEDGDLQGSIRKTAGRHNESRRVVAGGEATTRPVENGRDGSYDYALGQEFGTKDMPANPFFYPAKRSLAKRIRSRINRAARKAIRQHWGIGT